MGHPKIYWRNFLNSLECKSELHSASLNSQMTCLSFMGHGSLVLWYNFSILRRKLSLYFPMWFGSVAKLTFVHTVLRLYHVSFCLLSSVFVSLLLLVSYVCAYRACWRPERWNYSKTRENVLIRVYCQWEWLWRSWLDWQHGDLGYCNHSFYANYFSFVFVLFSRK